MALAEEINSCGASKVYIVAHSMGGLVANRYIAMGNGNKVAKLITIGTPYMGSPKALYSLETGDLGLDWYLPTFTGEMKQLGIRSNAAYQLLPSERYFNDLNTYYFSKDFFDPSVAKHVRKEYKSFNDMLFYLNKENPNLLKGFAQSAAEFQKKLDIDNNAHVDTYYIVGSGILTLGEIQDIWEYKRYENKWVYSSVKKLKLINGDETVPLISANRGHTNGKNNTWYVGNVSHSNLVSNENVLKQIKAILTGINPSFLPTKYYNGEKSIALTINSPVDLNVYDVNGNYLGAENNNTRIPLASYYQWDHNKFAVLREGRYNVKLIGTDTGVFSFTVDYYNGEEVENKVFFKDVPVQKGAVITTTIKDYQSKDLVLAVDNENDGIIDLEVLPTGILDSIAANDLTPPTITIRDEGTKGKNNWFTSDAVVYLEAYDEGGSRLKSAEYQLNENDFLQYTSPISLKNEGITKVQGLAIDGAGNTSLDLASKEIKIDKTVPVIKSNLQNEYAYGTVLNFVYEIQVSDTVSGINNFKITYDNTQITTNTLNLNQDGYHTIKVVAEDNAGLIQTYEKTFEVYIPATINFDPDTLNIKNDNPSIATVYIEFPVGFNVADISLQSILLNGSLVPIQYPQYGYVQNPVGDYNADGKDEFMVKFRRSDLATILEPEENVQILITGRASGVLFKGKDYITVIN